MMGKGIEREVITALVLSCLTVVVQADIGKGFVNKGPPDLKFQPAGPDSKNAAERLDTLQNGAVQDKNQEAPKLQKIGDKVYTAQQLDNLQQELQGSHFKRIDSPNALNNNANERNSNTNIVNNLNNNVNNINNNVNQVQNGLPQINKNNVDVNNHYVVGGLPNEVNNDLNERVDLGASNVHDLDKYKEDDTDTVNVLKRGNKNVSSDANDAVPAQDVNGKRREQVQQNALQNRVVNAQDDVVKEENFKQPANNNVQSDMAAGIKEEVALRAERESLDSNAKPVEHNQDGLVQNPDLQGNNGQREGARVVRKESANDENANERSDNKDKPAVLDDTNKGVFDVANQPVKVNPDTFDTNQQGGAEPNNVKFINGEVGNNFNEVPRNPEIVGQNNNNGLANNNNKVLSNEDEEKPGSMKVVWDWSDFAVNFEQYVMPEQKIRRAPHATTGEPWPLPQYYIAKKDKIYRVDKFNFRFDISKVRCDIIEKAIERYKPYILEDAIEDMYDNFQHSQSTMFEDPALKYDTPLFLNAPVVSKVLVKIQNPCTKFPHAKMDESYDLFVKRTGIHIWANEVWGALRGLETLSQIIFKGSNQLLYIRDTVINDYPRFSHRGMMIDTSRHFLFKETILDVLEAMSQNKMNTLHWHMVDDQSFPFYSQAYPDLSHKGAFHPTFVYMTEDIAEIIEFARLRGIRVEPEFDTPGHTYSWGLSRPDLLTQCYQGDHPVDGYLGPLDPSKNETFRFLKNFFKDVLTTFKDQYLHIGGDEVPMTCWQSNPEVTKFLAKLEGKTEVETRQTDPYYYSYDIRKVLEYYVTRLIKDLKSMTVKRPAGLRLVFWQEIMNNNIQLPNDSIIQVWLGGMEEVERAISLGMNVIYSTCWYINYIEYGTKWIKYYQCDPADASYGKFSPVNVVSVPTDLDINADRPKSKHTHASEGFTIDESKVLGGEAALWGEYLDNENYMTTMWPAGSATAERLWSHKDVRDIESAATRLQEHRCRMLSRGLPVSQMSGSDYCLRRGRKRHLENETMASNCTNNQCGVAAPEKRYEVENIKVEFEQKGGSMADCSQAWVQVGSQLTMALLVLVLVAVVITLSFTRKKIPQVRVCKNKTILMVFITLILLYFMCSTSIWMQAMEFKGSIEKRKSSNVQT
ncbi:uncharacterized protein LOC128242495 isoform X2 [Mya arenaria]|nr:uncharacterized protein LOC128242495 isoform X2 [Mya arenaria]XP_052815619.1 uncharacterized protein LOC128242495 isoform X2 [Mya arenaria]XP_052815620.1 uncharacterized protein LOC128242495 isoform X2 [Mya arenaria]XP_052815621.1 uncharacterized protein LOC128242495 isoform X2 [Mya arenaria]XP_052815622.1 uncharacterized protein LOC128242495 isoform X2 [Mya arenaria]